MKLTTRQRDALGHVAENCRRAAELAAELTIERLGTDWRARYSVMQCIQIIGEAVGRLGADFEAAHPTIPWRQISGMRNRLIHGYDNVSEVVLWQTLTEYLPRLLTQVESLLAEAD